MAFSATTTDIVRGVGRKKVAYGTFTQTADDSGGTITTGLKKVHTFNISVSSHIGSEKMKVTLNSAADGQVVLVTSTGAISGAWDAIGY